MSGFEKFDDGTFVTISFRSERVKDAPLAWQVAGLSYTASGYGSKIPTSTMVQLGKRWHRVYCMIYSNSGTCYIISKGKRFIVDIDCD